MKKLHIINYGMNAVLKRKGMLVLSLIMSAVAFFLVNYFLLETDRTELYRKAFEKATGLDADKVFFLDVRAREEKTFSSAVLGKQLTELGLCQACGAYREYADGERVTVFYDAQMVEWFDVKDDRGQRIDLTVTPGQYIPVYVGEAYRQEYPVGSLVTIDDCDYVVKGVLQQSRRIIPDPSQMDVGSIYLSDYVLVAPILSEDYEASYLLAGSGPDHSEIGKTLAGEGLAGYRISFGDLQKSYQKSNDEENRILKSLSAVIICSVLILGFVLASYLISCNTYDYAVHYANGFQVSDIFLMVVTENVFRLFLGAVCGVIAMNIRIGVVYGSGRASVIRDVMLSQQLGKTGLLVLLLALAVGALASIAPMIRIARLNLTDYFRAEE
ncbi:MAG: hypothetical protein J5643_02830 [Lachnospiraceae bacterium]|nr:hypothetical protein [Lachnospiraceae bacterium]